MDWKNPDKGSWLICLSVGCNDDETKLGHYPGSWLASINPLIAKFKCGIAENI